MGDEARVYTVRLWRHQGTFRAAVRLAGDDAAQLLESPQALAAYFAGEAEPRDPPACPVPAVAATPPEASPPRRS